MKGTALLFMLFSWGLVLSLSTYCFSKLFTVEARVKKRKQAKKTEKRSKKAEKRTD